VVGAHPQNPEWSWDLGLLYSLESRDQPTNADKIQTASMALAQFEMAAVQGGDQSDRVVILKNLANAAFDAGQFAKSRSFAQELLEKGPAQDTDWARGFAIHHGNLVLGRIALIECDIGEAKSRLIAAVTPPPDHASTVLGPEGPNMALCKDLLELGHRDVVLDYLRRCSPYWQSQTNRLTGWIAQIEMGLIPDFGANLDY
jgi:hypothetical protein